MVSSRWDNSGFGPVGHAFEMLSHGGGVRELVWLVGRLSPPEVTSLGY